MPTRRPTFLGVLLVFAIGVAVAVGLLSLTGGFVSNDDYYHARISSEIIAQGTLRVAFNALPLTILSPDQFVDHHLLYHIYLAPFAYWGGIGGAKLGQALIIGGICAALWLLLRRLHVRPAWLWVMALLALSSPFVYRMLMARAQGAAVLVLLIALYALFTRRDRWLLMLAFAFTWLYNGFILLPIFAALYAAAMWASERRFVWQPLVFALVGVAAGLIINPYFPQNITFIVEHLGEKVDIESGIRVGNEWYPYTTRALMENSPGMLLALVAGLFAPNLRRRRRDAVETTLLLCALVTLYMTFESRRFIEYAPVFALLFAAAALGRGGIDWARLLPDALHRLPASRLAAAAFAITIGVLGWTTLSSAREQIAEAPSGYMAGAAEWLRANTPSGALVFQTDWDDFPYLYYYNTHNAWLVGLDPTYLQVANPTLWDLWVPITDGIVERPSVVIRETFGASYVVSDTRHEAFAASADADPAMQLVYRDEDSLIWQIASAHSE
jgi:hypothetical protein